VAPGTSISGATPRVSSAVALLIDTAHSVPSLSNGSTTNRNGDVIYNGERSEVVKAALLAGADRVSRNTTDDDITDYRVNIADQTDNGLDRRYGAGQLNIYHSHHIIAAGEQDSDQDDHGGGTGQISVYGYDYDPAFGGQTGSNSEASYFFSTGVDEIEFTAALVWNIAIDPGPSSGFGQSAVLYDLDLELYEAVDPGNSSTWISIGESKSTSENTENIWVLLLPGKNYALQVTVGAGQAAFNSDYGLAWQLKAVIDAPNVIGQPQATAEANIIAAGLVVGTTAFVVDDTVGIGNVTSQFPVAGASVELGSVVNLVISLGPDDDNDGIPNATDNCVAVANGPNDTATAGPSQNDTDSDGYGNMCDADFNQDGGVNGFDLGIFKERFFTADPDADLNGDGGVNGFDLGIFKGLYFKPPGPSGMTP
jgi:hypothetical protein